MATRSLPRRVLVTGSGGFAGGYLLRELLDHGYDVFGIDRTPERTSAVLGSGRTIALDLADSGEVRTAIKKIRPMAVYHLAALAHVGKSWTDPYQPFQANTVNALNVYLTISAVMQKECRFLYVSSAEVYGNVSGDSLPVTEKTPEKPATPYGASKLCAERILRTVWESGGSPLLIARPFNHTGPGQHHSYALPGFAERIAEIKNKGLDYFRHGNLEVKRDFLDVRDVVRAYRLMMEEASPGGTFVIASGVSRSIGDLLKKMFELADVAPTMVKDPELCRPVDVPEFRGDADALRQRTGWEPRIPFKQTLVELLEDAGAIPCRA